MASKKRRMGKRKSIRTYLVALAFNFRSRVYLDHEKMILRGLLVLILTTFATLAFLLQPTYYNDAYAGEEAAATPDTTASPKIEQQAASKEKEQEKPDAQKTEEKPLHNTSIFAFGYVGSLELDADWLEVDGKSKGAPASNSGKGHHALPGGDNTSRDGKVPEVTIDCQPERVEGVISHYGYMTVIASKKGIIAKVDSDTGALVPISQRTLSQFSHRARSFFGYGKALLARIKRSHPNLGPVKLLFLCPLKKENELVALQQIFAAQLGVPLGQIALMNGYYDANLAVRFTYAFLKDGRKISGQNSTRG